MWPGVQYLEIHAEEMLAREIPASDFLEARERLVLGPGVADPFKLEVTFPPRAAFPRPRQPRPSGGGWSSLTVNLSGRLFADPQGGNAAAGPLPESAHEGEGAAPSS